MNQLNGSLVSMSKNDFTEDFSRAFLAKYGIDPPFGSDMGYNSFMLLASTYDSDSQRWLINMRNARFTGADGEISFESTGLRIPNIYFGKLIGGNVI
jgi:hypothetical protein